jgi:hypothetical protein
LIVLDIHGILEIHGIHGIHGIHRFCAATLFSTRAKTGA